MNTPSASRTISHITLVVLVVVALCAYTLFMKAYEVGNWRGFWFSMIHVVIVASGAWLSLRKVC